MASIVSRRRSRTTFASYVFALALFAPQMGVRAQDLVITELMAQNVQTLTDTDGEYSDWIEIYNAGDVEVDLEGYHLSDRTNNLAKWTFPSVVLPPGGFLTVFCSGKDFREVGLELHTNFELDADGEIVVLSDPQGIPISLFDYPQQVPDASYGVSTDSRAWRMTGLGTPLTFHVPTDGSLGDEWTALDFDDSAWQVGASVVGFGMRGSDGELVETDVEEEMRGVNGSIYLRIPFELDDFAEADLFSLSIRYDDGFVAWINGVEVARGNAPDVVTWNSEAVRSHSAARAEIFDLSAFRDALRSGRNVLAIQAMNSTLTGNDLFVLPELEVVDVGEIRLDVLQYFATPTPNRPNLDGFEEITPAPSFSHPGGAVVGGVVVELTTDLPDAEIRYTTDGSRPTATSTLYTQPITVDGTANIAARVFKDGMLPGRWDSRVYASVHPSLESFSSNLPLVVCTTFGRPMGTACDGPYTPGHVMVLDPAGDRVSLLDEPSASHRAGFRARGSSTCGRPKFSFNIEFWDENQTDTNVQVLDFPIDSDYVMYGPYNFDRALMRNPIAYWMSREVGWWAARTRFVECYFHTGSGPMTNSSYMGVYVLMEKNKRHAEKIDVERLTSRDNASPEVEGGYILKRDRVGAGEVATSAGGYGSLVFVYPKQPTIEQRAYITSYINQAIASLSPEISEPGDSELIDVTAWIDHHILNWYPKNVDAFRLSGYFHKARNGPLLMGPVWDYDRTMGCADDDRAREPTGFDNTQVGDGGTQYFRAGGLGSWYSILFRNSPPIGNDPWARAYRARWRELRRGPLRTERILGQIDAWAEELAEAAERNAQRWPGVRPRFGGFQGEVNHLKNWLSTRADWIDQQFIPLPVFSHEGGRVDEGLLVELTVESGAPIWYTLDGSDPRGQGSQPSATAIQYSGPITIASNVTIRARAFDGAWSAASEATFVTHTPMLTITELMYNPPDDTPEEDPNDEFVRSDYEFIEVKNVDSRRISLIGLRFGFGVTFTFNNPEVATLEPGEIAVIVNDLDAFQARYGTDGIRIAGQYGGSLGDSGERVRILGLLNESIVDFRYESSWYPETAGEGHSLVRVNPFGSSEDLSAPAAWQPSAERLGSPGREDSMPPAGLQKPGDISQDGRLNVSDAVVLLRHLFSGATALPCGPDLAAPGNVSLLDGNGDSIVDIADAVYSLAFIFQKGPAHVFGLDCAPIGGCPDACVE